MSGFGSLSKRRRKSLTSIVLGVWLFALFVGFVHACGLDEDSLRADQIKAVNAGCHGQGDQGIPAACAKFCSDDLPLLAKVKALQDPPAGQAFLIVSINGDSFLRGPVSNPTLLPSPDPPPVIAVNTRLVRLAL